MTGRHAAADDIDDEALAGELREPGAHRADGDPAPVDPQGEIGDGSVPADADLKPEAAPASKPSTRSGRRAATPKGSPS